ncbi:dienelactone hydrolase family protein [Bosea psychrotolerans]|uniref:dienelactone hydrolase family protein n=1 Tax=Bosea psychrotolerans TaxID=1871628 RepID=UPI001AECC593|nr:dienelactone hydrolase family protein [Bosea psychrotolerans]
MPTPSGPVAMEAYERQGQGPRPAIVVLSGSKGFGSPAYGEMAQAFNAAGLDVFLLHVLSREDVRVIAGAGGAAARKRYYAQRLPDWIGSARAAAAFLKARPRHAGKVGLLGISLGANVAAAGAADNGDIAALVLVDGGFPEGHSGQVRALPPLQLIWGSGDRVFPLSLGHDLERMARGLGATAGLDVYEGAGHDFFLRPGTSQARAAHRSAADFLQRQLVQRP